MKKVTNISFVASNFYFQKDNSDKKRKKPDVSKPKIQVSNIPYVVLRET